MWIRALESLPNVVLLGQFPPRLPLPGHKQLQGLVLTACSLGRLLGTFALGPGPDDQVVEPDPNLAVLSMPCPSTGPGPALPPTDGQGPAGHPSRGGCVWLSASAPQALCDLPTVPTGEQPWKLHLSGHVGRSVACSQRAAGIPGGLKQEEKEK